MKTQEFLSLLAEHPQKNLRFEYTSGKHVGANYHITEVKNVTIDAIDCGGKSDFWKETIVQLWESPDEHQTEEYISAGKALSILNRVDQIKPMERTVEIKFEYSNEHFHTAQLFVNDVLIATNDLILKLGSEQTNCKARELCGIPSETALESEKTACAPNSGCC